MVGVRRLVLPRAILHRLEELVGKRFHDERNDGFAWSGRGRRPQAEERQGEQDRERDAAGTGHARNAMRTTEGNQRGRAAGDGRDALRRWQSWLRRDTCSQHIARPAPPPICRMSDMSHHTRLVAVLSCSLVLSAAAPGTGAGPAMRTLSRQAFEDKVRGGWAGQMIGVSFGAPTEFRFNGRIIEGDLPAWTPNRIENAIDQDDLYVEMTFAAVMDRVGLEATSEQYGEAFRTSKYRLWHANAGARRLLDRGIKAPWSGHPKYNVHANDIDFQIEADFIGLMAPGLPADATHYATRVGRVMNYGDGLYGGVFVASMYAAAFFERDPRKVVEAGLASLPRDSAYARIIRDVLRWSAEHPTDWRRTWQLIEDTWDKDDPCPDGTLQPFNIDATLNGAYIALGLLYGARRLRSHARRIHARRAGLRLQSVERRRDPGSDAGL